MPDPNTETNRPRTVALATTGEFAHLDEDLLPTIAALEQIGFEAVAVDWHDPSFDWASCDLAIIRSTWDYTWQHEAFVRWAERVSTVTRLANPLEIVRWNIEKTYLVELARCGVPVVPTTVVAPGEAVDRRGLERHFTSDEVVVKPAVSAGARDTERYRVDDIPAVEAHVERLTGEGRLAMVQPYISSVDEEGETSLVYFGDAPSHAFRKGPILRTDAAFVEGLYREESIDPNRATADELAVAESALDAVALGPSGRSRSDLLYARVDVVRDSDGSPMVLELELIEPSFFLSHAPGAEATFARAVAAALD